MTTLITGCGGGGDTTTSLPSIQNKGTVSFNLTDAPTDDVNVKGVYVTFHALRYQYAGNDDKWEYIELNESRTINLLDLQDGKTTLLHEIELPAGEISHVNFIIDTNECYVDLYVGGLQPLDVTNSDEIGFRAFGGFTIEAGQTVTVTADFDVRKSVKLTENGEYILCPAIKIVDNNDVGCIKGIMDLRLTRDISSVIVYAYQDGTWNANESNTTNNFRDAVVSNSVKMKSYTLSWIPIGTYDLVIVAYDSSGEFKKILGYMNDVSVGECEITSQNITNDTLMDMLP
jgi:hypothetical protein